MAPRGRGVLPLQGMMVAMTKCLRTGWGEGGVHDTGGLAVQDMDF